MHNIQSLTTPLSMSEENEIKPIKVKPLSVISEIDVLQHFAATATFPYHKRKFVDPPVSRKRIRIPKQKNPYKKPQHMIDAEREQDESRKRASSVTSQPDYSAAPVPSGSRHVDSPRNILPPPPPLEEPIPETTEEPIGDAPEESGEVVEESSQEPASTDHRPQWIASTPLPPHLQRQAQLLPPAPSTISEEDAMEVDELATPGDGKADVGAEDGVLTGSPAGKGRRSEPGGNLLSLPRRLWSSIRPGILS